MQQLETLSLRRRVELCVDLSSTLCLAQINKPGQSLPRDTNYHPLGSSCHLVKAPPREVLLHLSTLFPW